MAHVKSSGRARQGTPRKGRRLGIKISGGAEVKTGQVILRQRGSSFHDSSGTKKARDFTIFAARNGKVCFKTLHGKRTVEVV